MIVVEVSARLTQRVQVRRVGGVDIIGAQPVPDHDHRPRRRSNRRNDRLVHRRKVLVAAHQQASS